VLEQEQDIGDLPLEARALEALLEKASPLIREDPGPHDPQLE
jgi:hypothetical protein